MKESKKGAETATKEQDTIRGTMGGMNIRMERAGYECEAWYEEQVRYNNYQSVESTEGNTRRDATKNDEIRRDTTKHKR